MRMTSATNQRNSSIELLRIISMIGVVILHYNNSSIGGGFGFVKEGSVNQHYLFMIEGICVCAVNLFMIVSAYFLSTNNNRKIIKVIELIIQVVLFRIAFYIIDIFSSGGIQHFSIKNLISCLLPINYFVILYSVVYILSPYINVLLEKLDRKQTKKLIVTLIVIFSFWTILVDVLENITNFSLKGLSTVGMYGSQYGYSIVNFFLIYFIGAYIRKYNIRFRSMKLVFGIIINTILIFLFSTLEHILGLSRISSWNYNNPLVICLAILVFLLFINLSFYSKLINELARGAFTCFLFHSSFMYRMHIASFVNKNLFVLILHQFGVAIALYLVSYIIYKLYYLCSHWLIKALTPLCNKINISL